MAVRLHNGFKGSYRGRTHENLETECEELLEGLDLPDPGTPEWDALFEDLHLRLLLGVDICQDFEAVVKLASVTELLIGEGQQTPVSIAFFTYSCA